MTHEVIGWPWRSPFVERHPPAPEMERWGLSASRTFRVRSVRAAAAGGVTEKAERFPDTRGVGSCGTGRQHTRCVGSRRPSIRSGAPGRRRRQGRTS